MGFEDCVMRKNSILMEGALGERLKREYCLHFDDDVAMAKLIYSPEGRSALSSLLREYYQEGESEAAVERIKQTLDIIVNGISEKR